jgi:hypothetical protein
MADKGTLSEAQIEYAYRPILFMMMKCPRPLRIIGESYASLCGGGLTLEKIQTRRAMKAYNAVHD